MPPPLRPVSDAYDQKKQYGLHIRIPPVSSCQYPPSPAMYTGTVTSPLPDPEDLRNVVQSVQNEFNALTERYQNLSVSLHQNENEIGQEESLNTVLDALEQKGRQLYWIKHAAQGGGNENDKISGNARKSSFRNYERTVIHSPEASRRKENALHLLQEYREMDNSTTLQYTSR